MISVRLSEEEFSALRRHCLLTGARSVSDLTRDAVHGLLSKPTQEGTLGIHADEFRSQLHSLDKKIEQLVTEIASIKTNGNLE